MNEIVRSADAASKKINTIIHARNIEIELIKNGFSSVVNGDFGACFISGPPGIGKTCLVRYAAKEMGTTELAFVCGKFRQNDNKPLIAISEILEQITKNLLTLPQDKLSNVKNAIKGLMGSDAQVIVSLCPYAAKLVGQQNPMDTGAYGRIRYRVRRAIYQFISIACEALFPLIVFIDDLHWADTSSVDVIEALMKNRQYLNIYLIFAYRDDEAKALRNIEIIRKKTANDATCIKLKALSDQDIRIYLQMLFGDTVQGLNYVARITYGLSMGNPLYLRQMIELFVSEGILTYSDMNQNWTVDLNRINDIVLPKNVGEVISQRLERISGDNNRLLEFVACLDGQASFSMLARLTGYREELLEGRLGKLCGAALLIRDPDANEPSFSFVHDTVFELIYQNIPEDLRAKTHFDIANELAQGFAPLFIASHLMRADISLLKANSLKWANLLYRAGIEAKQTTVIEYAQKIFETCLELRADKKITELCLNIRLELMECFFLTGREEKAKSGYKELIKEYPNHVLAIKRRYLSLYAYRNDAKNVMQLGEEILGHLNFKIRMPVIDILFSWKTFKGIDKIKDIKNTEDKRILIIIDTMVKMVSCAYAFDVKRYQILLLQMGILAVRYGYSYSAAIGYAAYSLMYNSVWKNPKKMLKVAEITLECTKDTDSAYGLSMSYFVIGSFILPLSIPLRNSIVCLQKSVESGKRTGDFISSGYSAASIVHVKYLSGEPLPDVRRHIDTQQADPVLRRQHTLEFVCDIYKRHIQYLAAGKEQEIKLKNKQILSIDTYRAFQVEAYYLTGKTMEAYAFIKKIKANTFKGYVLVLNYTFFSTLVRIEIHPSLNTKEQRINKKAIKQQIKEIEYWVKICKDNHYAQLLLLKAVYADLFDINKPSEKLYNEAIVFAERQGNLRIAAIGNLLAAKKYRGQNKFAKFYAQEAVSLLRKWGALYVARLTEKDFGLAAGDGSEKPETAAAGQSEISVGKNILAELSDIQAMDETQAYKRLAELIAEVSDADYAAIIFEQSNDMYLHYEMRGEAKAFEQPRNVNYVSGIAHKVIRYVQRTGEVVVVKNKSEAGIFAGDSHISQKGSISILCMPLSLLGILIGVVYIENSRGFSEAALQAVKSMIPLMASKRTTISNVNIKSILSPRKASSPLSGREQEILERIAKGVSNSDISEELGITMGTVRNHLSSIYGKLEADSRIQAVLRAKEMNIIDI